MSIRHLEPALDELRDGSATLDALLAKHRALSDDKILRPLDRHTMLRAVELAIRRDHPDGCACLVALASWTNLFLDGIARTMARLDLPANLVREPLSIHGTVGRTHDVRLLLRHRSEVSDGAWMSCERIHPDAPLVLVIDRFHNGRSTEATSDRRRLDFASERRAAGRYFLALLAEVSHGRAVGETSGAA